MIYVGIDVAKDKHDCFITNSDGEVLFQSFTILNNREGFETLFQRIQSVSDDFTNVKVEPEATVHYSYNLLGFLISKGLPTYVINPLHINLYRKSLSLRKTKTDKVDSRTIATMMMSDMNLKSYSDTSYHNEELKSQTRYRFDKVKERSKTEKFCLQTYMHPVPRTRKTCFYASYGIRLCFAFRSSKCICPSYQTDQSALCKFQRQIWKRYCCHVS